MDIVPRKQAPRLLDSAVSIGVTRSNQAQTARLRAGRRGRGGIALVLFGIIAVSIVGWISTGPTPYASSIRKLVGVATQSVTGPHPSLPPEPIVIQLSTEVLQVTAIALGHPRLAVINGTSVTEGDRIVVHVPTHSVALTLRVLKIADGRVDLSDGMHVVTARLTVPTPVKR
jgi:hypothetical protein